MSGQSKAGTWRTIKRLEKSIPQVKWYRGELMLMSLFVNIFALGLPIFILQVYDRILPNLGLTTMQFLVIGLVIVMVLDFILKSIRAAVTTYTGARFEHLARVAAVDKILRTPQDVYEQETPGAYLDKVNAIGVVKEFYSSQLGTLFIDLPFAVFFLGMIWFLGGLMVVVPITLLVLFGIMAIVVGGNLRRAVDTRGQVDNRRYDFLIEIINGIHTVKAQAFKNLLQRRFESLQETSARAVRSVAMQSSIAQSLGSTFGQLNMASVIGLGAVLVIDGQLSAGELAACTLLSGRAMQPLQSAMGLWTNFQTIRVACDNAMSVMELPAEDLGAKPEMPGIAGEVEFRDVSFRYDGMDHPFIENLNLNIKAGSMIGIEGDNSSGRSTILKLMIGIIRPTSGQIMIDGYDLAQHQSHSYREQMAFLSADADVYTGTILDNMTYFRGGRYIKRAMDLSKKLGLDEEIKRLPEGYGTHIGDGAGGVLPAGFAQRITIVRAMVDDPKIVLFDNANHGLDSNTDRILLDYITGLRGKATVILVSARPSWLRVADTRYVMSDGDMQLKAEDQPALENQQKETASVSAPSSTPKIAPPEAPAPTTSDAATTTEQIEQNSPKPDPVAKAAPPRKPVQAAPEARPSARPNNRQVERAQPQPAPKKQARPNTAKSTNEPQDSKKPASTPPAQKARPAAVKRPATPTSSQPAQRKIEERPKQAPPTNTRKPVQPAKKPEQARQPAQTSQRPAQTRPQRPVQSAPTARRQPERRPSAAPNTVRKPVQSQSTPVREAAKQPVNVSEKGSVTPSPSTQPRVNTPKRETIPANSPQKSAPPPVQPAQQNRPRPANTRPADQSARPANKPTNNVPPQRSARPATAPAPTRRPPATQNTAQASNRSTSQDRTVSQPPKPAATLRPATAAAKPGNPGTATTTRPQPPKPRRVDPHSAGLGGSE